MISGWFGTTANSTIEKILKFTEQLIKWKRFFKKRFCNEVRAELNANFDFHELKNEYRTTNSNRMGGGSISVDIVGQKKKFFATFGELSENARLELVREILELDAKFIKAFTYDRRELSLDGVKLQDIMQLNR